MTLALQGKEMDPTCRRSKEVGLTCRHLLLTFEKAMYVKARRYLLPSMIWNLVKLVEDTYKLADLSHLQVEC